MAGELVSAIAQAGNVEVAIELALREICAMTGWELGQAWIRNDGPYLECSPGLVRRVRRSSRRSATRSESMTFGQGEGLPDAPGRRSGPYG